MAAARSGFDDLSQRLGYAFSDPDLLERALTHSSHTEGRREGSNERLEFLGDRVLSLVVAEMLLQRFPGEDEGAIARRHTALVRGETLAAVAAEIGLGENIVMAKSEADTGGRANPALLADCCEAVIAAIYRDGGLEAARGFIERYWRERLEDMPKPPQDAKTALQEWVLARGMTLPRYREIAREGPDHEPRFTVEAAVEGYKPVLAEGSNKRAAEQAAACGLLERVRRDG